MTDTLEERGRALENQFFDKENKEKLAAMKSKLESEIRNWTKFVDAKGIKPE